MRTTPLKIIVAGHTASDRAEETELPRQAYPLKTLPEIDLAAGNTTVERRARMMKGTGRCGKIELSIGDQPFAVISDRALDFEIGGATYTVKRTGLLNRKYRLSHGQDLIVLAEMQPFLFSFRITHAGAHWLLKTDGLTAVRYELFHDAEMVGCIAPTYWFDPYRDITIDLPDALSPPVQVFLLWLVARHWPG
jgi:hypothetical protein